MDQNLGILGILGAVILFRVLRWLVFDRPGGVMTLVNPLLVRCHLNFLVREGSGPSDTPKNGADTPGDTPGDTYTTETLADGAIVIGKPMSTTIRIPHMVRIGEPGSPDGPPVTPPGPERATQAQIESWIRLRTADRWTRAQILTEGQSLFGVSESTMVRRYKGATS